MKSGTHKLKPRRKIKSCHDTAGGCRQRTEGIPYYLARLGDLPDKPNPPSPITKVKHLAKAGGRILKGVVSGEPIRVSDDVLKQRDEICSACGLWRPSGNLGMGECRHPQCGCTKFKRGFTTETCPAGKWGRSVKPD